MKANELMVGDWVLTLESTHKEKVYAQIWAIEEGQTSILVKKDNCNWFVDIEWIEPIPLTPEILEKNGFKKCDGCNQWTLYKPHFYCILCDIDKPYLEIASYNVDIGEFNRSGIRFIHELQHALRLCGIEKEIEL